MKILSFFRKIKPGHSVGKLPGSKAVCYAVYLYFIDGEHLFHMVMRVDHSGCFVASLPAVLIDIYAKQPTKPGRSGGFELPACAGLFRFRLRKQRTIKGLSPIGTQREPMGLNAVYGED